MARHGYVNLNVLSKTTRSVGDTAAMVDARARFLGQGHYDPLAQLVAATARRAMAAGAGCILECGAGPAYYLRAVIDDVPERIGIAVDVSTYAARRAAKAHARIASIVADVEQRIPLRSHSVAVALSIFAPRNAEELSRMIAPGGCLVVAVPAPGHLSAIADAVGLIGVDPRKRERVVAKLRERFTLVAAEPLDCSLRLSHEDLIALVSMGPNAFHLDPSTLLEAVRSLRAPVNVTASFEVLLFQRVVG